MDFSSKKVGTNNFSMLRAYFSFTIEPIKWGFTQMHLPSEQVDTPGATWIHARI